MSKSPAKSIPRLSDVIRDLTNLLGREGDIECSVEGYFGEVMPPKYAISNRATARNGFWHADLDKPEDKGELIIKINHLT